MIAKRGFVEESGLGRLIGVLVAPRRTFEAVARTPTWAPPLVALLLGTALNSFVLIGRTDFVALTAEAFESSGREADAEQVELVAGLQETLAPVTAVVSVPSALLVLALVFWVSFKLIGGELSYRQSLATVGHGLLPWLPAMLLSLPSLLGRRGFGFADYQQLGFFPATLPSSLTAVAPEGASASLLAVLSSIDLFSLWSMVLLSLGFAVVARVSRATAATTVVALWAVYVLGKLGWTLVGTV